MDGGRQFRSLHYFTLTQTIEVTNQDDIRTRTLRQDLNSCLKSSQNYFSSVDRLGRVIQGYDVHFSVFNSDLYPQHFQCHAVVPSSSVSYLLATKTATPPIV